MNPLIRFLSFLVFGLAFSGGSALAAPNGYTLIPIAKVFGNGVAAFSLNLSRYGFPTAAYSSVYTMQYGLLNRFEVGMDFLGQPAAQSAFLGNVKYLLVHAPGRLPDVACGVTNIAGNQKALPYLVATTQPAALGVSFGVTATGATHSPRLMGGVAYNLSPQIQIVSDCTGGGQNVATLGVIASVGKNATLNLAYARPNQGSGALGGSPSQRGFVFNIAYVFHALHGKGGAGSEGGTNKNPTAAGGAH